MTSWLKSREKPSQAVHLALERADYTKSYRLQHQLHALRCQGKIPDTILSVVHDPVFTIGRSGSRRIPRPVSFGRRAVESSIAGMGWN